MPKNYHNEHMLLIGISLAVNLFWASALDSAVSQPFLQFSSLVLQNILQCWINYLDISVLHSDNKTLWPGCQSLSESIFCSLTPQAPWGVHCSGQRFQILSHVFARCASQKTHGHARIARETHGHARIARITRAILAYPCVFWLAQHAKTCDTNQIPLSTA